MARQAQKTETYGRSMFALPTDSRLLYAWTTQSSRSVHMGLVGGPAVTLCGSKVHHTAFERNLDHAQCFRCVAVGLRLYRTQALHTPASSPVS